MRPRVVICLGLAIVAMVLIPLHSILLAQMIPNAPVENFRLPMFNAEGYRTWELRGAKGIYRDGDHVDLVAMEIQLFTGDASGEVQTEITSPDATVLIAENKAVGHNGILITNRDFKITGQNWTWHGNEDRVSIETNVEVTFFEGIGDILK